MLVKRPSPSDGCWYCIRRPPVRFHFLLMKGYNMITGYCYEIVDGDKRQVFLTALDDYFNIDEIFNLCWFFEDHMKRPELPMDDTLSYFTKRGNRKFHKAILAAKKAYEEKGVKFEFVQREIKEEEVMYKDDFQIICYNFKQ